ncbi:hypothetical protein [Spirosoma flavum]|uniref:Uncharacterized protein n=1 Tax=Spirosoma flavum TaxID=2048557 RepID=A0ABW6AFL0_9BACT
MGYNPIGRLFATRRTNALSLLLCLFFASLPVVAQQNQHADKRKAGDSLDH